MRNSNFGIGVLHVKVKYYVFFGDVISLLAQVFIVSSNRGVYKTIDLWPMEVIF